MHDNGFLNCLQDGRDEDTWPVNENKLYYVLRQKELQDAVVREPDSEKGITNEFLEEIILEQGLKG